MMNYGEEPRSERQPLFKNHFNPGDGQPQAGGIQAYSKKEKKKHVCLIRSKMKKQKKSV